MALTEGAAWPAENRGNEPVANKPQADGIMESRTHCAYNQTRECFLGLQVKKADLSSTHVTELLSSRPLQSGDGVWMNPFRGIQASAMPVPLDLIYLDQDCRVIDTVESFPTFHVSTSAPRPQSVLALPAHSIYSSQTQVGDQLVLCVAEEMEQHLERLTGVPAGNMNQALNFSIAGAAVLRDKPLWSGGPGVLELENRLNEAPSQAQQAYEIELVQPSSEHSRQPRNWLDRWWSPDPRKAPRLLAPGLAAYYWNGAAPQAHGIRDISTSGLYVVTEERWYPGTLVLMTLQRTSCGEEVEERSIAVQSRAVRWGSDGVGLQFILYDERDKRKGKTPVLDAASREDFDRFLKQLRQS
jgi:uncharacterized protein